jgi:hypothetical protein
MLEIEGYLGLSEEGKVLTLLKSAAAAGGTVLVTHSVKNKAGRLVISVIVVTNCSSHAFSPMIGIMCPAQMFRQTIPRMGLAQCLGSCVERKCSGNLM